MKNHTEQCRRDRILDAAEHAFAEAGFAGASLRDIVLAAQVNLATVYYYFGSKNGLMEAVLKRRFGPLRQEHLDLLKAAQLAANGRPLGIEQILQAMLLPPLRVASGDSAQRQAVMRLIGRIVNEPSREIQDILHMQRAEVREAFFNALRASVPGLSREELLWRMEFVWGALTFILCNPKKIERETHGECNPTNTGKVLDEMIRFFSPGFQNPSINGRGHRETEPRAKGRLLKSGLTARRAQK